MGGPTGGPPGPPGGTYDCAGVLNGTAYYDACGICVGGTTGNTPCATPIFIHQDMVSTAYSNLHMGLDGGANQTGNGQPYYAASRSLGTTLGYGQVPYELFEYRSLTSCWNHNVLQSNQMGVGIFAGSTEGSVFFLNAAHLQQIPSPFTLQSSNLSLYCSIRSHSLVFENNEDPSGAFATSSTKSIISLNPPI